MTLFWTQKKFFEAAATGDNKTVAAYLAKSKDWVKCRDKKSAQMAIHLAVENGHVEIVKRLLSAGAREWWTGSGAQSPLHKAALYGHVDIARLLLDAGASVNINQKDGGQLTPVQYAIKTGRAEILKMFLDTKQADLNIADSPALYYAVENRQKDCVEVLLAAGADPNVPKVHTRHEYDDDYDDYYYSRSSSSTPIVSKFSPLSCACLQNETDIALGLLKAGAKTLPDEFPLHAAAGFGNTELATALMGYGYEVNAKTADNSTPLHCAAQKNRPQMARFLLSHGARKDMLNNDLRTALSYAQQYAMTELIELLQGPLPVLAPKPLIPVVVAPPIAAEMPLPAPAAVIPAQDETWALSGSKSVVHMTHFPPLNRRLTEIFNFETRERIAITENLALKTETMGPHENFDNIGDEALRKAFGEFRRLGGKAEESAIFGTRLMKIKARPC